MGIKIELHILCQITHITDYCDDRHTSKQYLESRIKNSCRCFNQGDIPSKKEITRILGGYYTVPTTILQQFFSFFFSLLAKGVVIQPQLKNWTISHINKCDQREFYIFKKIRTFRYLSIAKNTKHTQNLLFPYIIYLGIYFSKIIISSKHVLKFLNSHYVVMNNDILTMNISISMMLKNILLYQNRT